MKVLLAGATGVLGRAVVRELAEAGHQVTWLGRGEANALRADLCDRQAVLRAVDGLRFDAAVHAATALHGKLMTRHKDLADTDELRTRGTANLIAAARETGARRLVVESMMFGYGFGDHGDEPLSEDGAPFGPVGPDPRTQQHVDAIRTMEELAFAADGIKAVSLRFGFFYGIGTTDATMVPMLRRRLLPLPPDRGNRISWIDVADAGRAVRVALDEGQAGQAYNIVDDTPMSFGSHVRMVAEVYRTPKPPTIPLWALKATPLANAVMSAGITLSNEKARRELGWAPLAVGAREAVECLAGRDLAMRG